MSADGSAECEAIVVRLRALIEWVSERDHGRSVELDAVVHELETLANAEAVARQAMLEGMSVEQGATVLSLRPPRELAIMWVHMARGMLGDAENYSETRVDFPSWSVEVKAAYEVDRYVLTVQRAGKLTPHDARKRAEAERDALRERLRVALGHDELPDDDGLILDVERWIRLAQASNQPVPAAKFSAADINEMTDEQRVALPAIYHRPVFFGYIEPPSWICDICWGEGWTTGWPCAPARTREGGQALGKVLGLEVVW